MLRHCKTNGLAICIALDRQLGNPQGTHGSPRGMVQLWQFFFPVGEEGCSVLETISLDHGNIPTEFVLDRIFFLPFYFTSMANFDTVSRLFILSARKGLFLINFMSFTQGFWMVLFVTKHNPWGSTHEETNFVSQYENFRDPFINTNVFISPNAFGCFFVVAVFFSVV